MKFIQKLSAALFVVTIAAFSFTSCSSDDDGDISGTYTLTLITSSGCSDPAENLTFDLSGDGCQDIGGVEACVVGTMTISESTFSIQFTISGAGVSQTTTASGPYTVEGNSITVCDSDGCESATFNASNDELTIRVPADEDGCILTMTGKK